MPSYDPDRIAELEDRVAGRAQSERAEVMADLELLADLYMQADSHLPAASMSTFCGLPSTIVCIVMFMV